MTSLITEALKTMLPNKEYSKNILAGIVAVVVSIAVSIGYLILSHTAISQEIIVYIVILIVLSWLCAMLGYDKVMQTIAQIRTKKTE